MALCQKFRVRWVRHHSKFLICGHYRLFVWFQIFTSLYMKQWKSRAFFGNYKYKLVKYFIYIVKISMFKISMIVQESPTTTQHGSPCRYTNMLSYKGENMTGCQGPNMAILGPWYDMHVQPLGMMAAIFSNRRCRWQLYHDNTLAWQLATSWHDDRQHFGIMTDMFSNKCQLPS